MLQYFSTWNTIKRQQRALFTAFAEWQSDTEQTLGSHGLSVTTEISAEPHDGTGTLSIQFTLHHKAGGHHDSGIITIGYDPEGQDWSWLQDVTSPFLSEFLLPSADFTPEDEPHTHLHVVQA